MVQFRTINFCFLFLNRLSGSILKLSLFGSGIRVIRLFNLRPNIPLRPHPDVLALLPWAFLINLAKVVTGTSSSLDLFYYIFIHFPD